MIQDCRATVTQVVVTDTTTNDLFPHIHLQLHPPFLMKTEFLMDSFVPLTQVVFY